MPVVTAIVATALMAGATIVLNETVKGIMLGISRWITEKTGVTTLDVKSYVAKVTTQAIENAFKAFETQITSLGRPTAAFHSLLGNLKIAIKSPADRVKEAVERAVGVFCKIVNNLCNIRKAPGRV